MDELNRENVIRDVEKWSKLMLEAHERLNLIYKDWQELNTELKNG